MVSEEKDPAATAGSSAARGFAETPVPTGQPYP